MTGDDLAAIEPWIGALAARLKPAERRRLALKVGQLLRRQNAARIAANVQPDGSAMEPRKPRPSRLRTKAGRIKKKGKMFRKVAKARTLKVRPDADGVELGFANPLVEKTAAEHHYGLTGFVGITSREGKVIRTRYPERRLLGFGREDPDAIMDLVLDHLAG